MVVKRVDVPKAEGRDAAARCTYRSGPHCADRAIRHLNDQAGAGAHPDLTVCVGGGDRYQVLFFDADADFFRMPYRLGRCPATVCA